MNVIYINFLGSYSKGDYYLPGSDSFFNFGIGQFISSEFINRGYPLTAENWRVDARIDHVIEKSIDGILYRIFPPFRFFKVFDSFSIKMALMLREKSKNPEVIFHFMGTHLLNYYLYAILLGKKRSIATHLGDPNPLWRYNRSKKLKHLIFYFAEKYFFLKYYKYIVTICKAEVTYYEKIGIPVKHMPVYGICREKQFIIKDRQLCRKKLELPSDKKIILQVGRAVEYRGFDWILPLIDHYEDKDDYLFVFLGINKWDPYYEELVKRKCIVKGYMEHLDLVDYYNAADVFIFFIVGEKVLTFGGTGYVPFESLACGTPVVATSLHHIKNTRVTEVTRIPNYNYDVIPMIEELISLNINRELCREIALNIFSWDSILREYWGIYSNK